MRVFNIYDVVGNLGGIFVIIYFLFRGITFFFSQCKVESEIIQLYHLE